MTASFLRASLIIIDILIVLSVIAGFVYLKKYLNAHKDDKSQVNQDKIKRIIRNNGILLAALGFIAIAIGIGSKLF